MKKWLKRWFGSGEKTTYEQAFALHTAGRLDEAYQHYQAVLQHEPRHAAALAMLGTIGLQRGDAAAALPFITQSLAVDANQPEAYCNQGFALATLKRPEEALASYDRALALQPDFVGAHVNRGNTLRDLRRFAEALASYDRAIALNPDLAMAHNSRGAVLKELNRLEEAMASYDRAIALAPEYAEAWYNRGDLLHVSHHFEQALEQYDHALALNPNYVDAEWSKALLLILHGHYEEGWKLYESRRRRPEMQSNYPAYPQPLWLGEESLAGKTLLVYAEQGLGDAIQFCRYIPLLEKMAQGGQVLLMVHPPLVPLLRTLEGDFRIVHAGATLPPFDYHCPLLSLPLVFKTRLSTVPAAVPYLGVEGVKRLRWQKRLGAPSKLRIGLAWSGATGHLDDHNRSMSLSMLQPLLDMEAIEFHVLQKDIREGDKAMLNQLSSCARIHWRGDELHDFSETAALVEQMDGVVSVDTSIAHLAGALGKSVAILLPHFPDYRWLLHRSDSPWYPTATLFRQPQRGDWAIVVNDVKNHLTQKLQNIPITEYKNND